MCIEAECQRQAREQGRCHACYERLRRAGKIETREKDPIARFWSRVDRNGPKAPDGLLGRCWMWTRSTNHGYGQVSIGGHIKRAHRLAYELSVGPVPDGLDIDHLCHERDSDCPGGVTCPHRRCCNPDHLRPATRRTNVLRGVSPLADKAARSHCEHGHEFTPENTYLWRGGRCCRACRRQADERRCAERKAARRQPRAATCRICGGQFDCVGGRPRTLCSDPCRSKAARESARLSAGRRRAG